MGINQGEGGKLGQNDNYQRLLSQISDVYTQGRIRATQAVNYQLIQTYWEIGRYIVEFEQGGNVKAEYGRGLLTSLVKDLTVRFGKGFSRSNVIRFRQFYLLYPKGATLSHLLSWSHVVELLKIDDSLERSFYEKQAMAEKWSVRELMRQKETGLFLRLAASRDREGILKLAQQGQVVEQVSDILRDPYVFEFLKWQRLLASALPEEDENE
jgi:DUF1016 N-terminal domain